MTAATAVRSTRRRRLFCHTCKRTITRADLDPTLRQHAPYPWTFTCTTCAAEMRSGHRQYPTSIRGLVHGSDKYFAKTTAQLTRRIVTDAPAPAGDQTPAPPALPWKACQRKHLARPDLTPGDKYCFMAHAQFADWKTGANCVPRIADLVASFGETPQWWTRHRARLVRKDAIRLLGTHTATGFGQPLVQFLGDDFASPAIPGKKVWVHVSAPAARHTPPRRDERGLWAAQ